MERYEFKYGDPYLTVILPLLGFYVLTRFTGLDSAWHRMWFQIGRSDLYQPASIALGAIIFVGGMWIGFNRKGYAILHKKHVEIKMGWGKVREIKYSQIKEVSNLFTPSWRWFVDVQGGRSITAGISLSTKHNKVLEELMKELKKRAKV